MSMLSLRLPESLHRLVRDAAAKDSISINQFIATAVAEKVSALLTEEYLEQKARRADPAAFDRLLRRVPDAAPLPGDEREPPPVQKRSKRRVRSGGQGRGRRQPH